jgi:hypothetical protein
MKKFIFLAAASLVLLASCEKEKNNNGPASTGVTGEWVADHVTLAFQHPDLTSIDLSVISPELGEIAISDIVAMGNEAINTGLKEDPSVSADLILTEDGNLIIDGLDVPITYTVDNSTLNVHVDQSVISGIAEQIKNEQDVMDILSLLGLSGLVENPQSVDLPLTYSVSESSLSLTADQNTAAPYMEMLAPAVETLTGLLNSLTYEMFSALLENAGLELADTVTPENFPAIKQLMLDVFSALTDGKAEYSFTTDFIPYAG